MLSNLKQWLFPSPEELELRKQKLQRRIDERKGKSQPEPVIRVSFPSKRPGPLPPITLSSPATLRPAVRAWAPDHPAPLDGAGGGDLPSAVEAVAEAVVRNTRPR